MRHDFDIAAFDPHPAWRVKRSRSRERSVRAIPPRNPNVWPLPIIAGVSPDVAPKHDGVSFSYDEATSAHLPRFVPVFAVGDGVVVYAGSALDAHAIVLDHGDGRRSFYAGLTHSFVMPTARRVPEQTVKAGDVLGYVCPSEPAGGALHFTLMEHDLAGQFRAQNVVETMRSWALLPYADDRTTPPAHQAIAA